MSEINENAMNEIESLQETFNQIKKSQEKPNSSSGSTEQKIKKEDLIKKYFTPTKDKEIFRALPVKKGQKRIEEAHFHVIQVNTPKGKQYKKIYCPAHNNPKVPKLDANNLPVIDPEGKQIMVSEPCPLCDKYNKIIATQTPLYIKKENYSDEDKKIAEKNKEIFKEASLWEAKKFYIIKGIDKGQQKDGPKFWRFKHNFKKQGVLDKLGPVLTDFYEVHQKDFTDVEFGLDISITTAKQTLPGTNKEYTEVTSIGQRNSCKLTDDPIQLKEWLDDDLTWRDVYKLPSAPGISSKEYLEMVVNGTQPYFDDSDSNNKHWVFPGRPDLQEKANTRNRDLTQQSYIANANIETITPSQVTPNPVQPVNLTQQINNMANSVNTTQQSQSSIPEDTDDLPF